MKCQNSKREDVGGGSVRTAKARTVCVEGVEGGSTATKGETKRKKERKKERKSDGVENATDQFSVSHFVSFQNGICALKKVCMCSSPYLTR